MKNLLIVFLLAASFQVFAQESALLRVNYNKGDVYETTVIQKQSTGIQSGTDMSIVMDTSVKNVTDELIQTESKISSIAMVANQGGMTMSYDSSKSDDELDATGKMLKSQLSPMMSAVILSTIDIYGNIIETSVEPAVPGMEQFTSAQSTINYPKEKIFVGSTWTSENENQGMKVITNYTVTNIADGLVYIDIQGDVSGVGTGSMKGKSEIEISTGIAKNTETVINVAAQGVEVTISSQVQMTKK